MTTNQNPVLEVRHLRAVDAIDREGTVTAAARRLHLTQSAVSHILKDLEERLGVELFRRDRGMEPTVEGERLLVSARRVLEEIERAEHDLARLREGHEGVLRIVTECYTCYHWLPSILRHFREEHPGIDLQLVPDATTAPLEALRDGAVELAIVHSPPADEPDIETVPLFSDELVAAVAPDHPYAGRRRLEPADFRNHTLVLHSDPEDSVIVVDFLRPAGVAPERVLELQLSEAVIEAVRSGLGITAMARWSITPQLESGELIGIRLAEEGLWRRWHAAVPARRARWPAVRSLVALLRSGALSAAERCAAGPDPS